MPAGGKLISSLDTLRIIYDFNKQNAYITKPTLSQNMTDVKVEDFFVLFEVHKAVNRNIFLY